MKCVLALFLLIGVAYSAYYEDNARIMIDLINDSQDQWKAGYNTFFRGWSLAQIKSVMGTKLDPRPGHPVKQVSHIDLASIPSSFDARTQWSNCRSVSEIRDQANCGSCWAVAAAEVASDRTCIGSSGAKQPEISAENLMTCCTACGNGCQGGYPIEAMNYWQNTGIVTGGNYDSHLGCQPYEIPPCGPGGCSGPEHATPPCSKSCESGYSTSYSSDKRYAKSHYSLSSSVSALQQELITNGPIEAAFSVYSDFMHYKSGVYTRSAFATFMGGHAVRFIGWGEQKATSWWGGSSMTPYWLVANSWNKSWGLQGLFKIKRGVNECGIESQCVAGMAKV